ncbi:RHS repeat-associated core domain-containing protein [Taibaiella soli]|uniref:DUF6443 domain-containing protein n=1 Tax=Taibaiella soli TaxID=1649169 RepID=A0A2W2C3W6_9BACT|nr:RHS repeat-associated core domain-containing protein [Taibaiella soli]PZF74813.1 hypothetical protein DN068_01040 [Taibaiella soli]
MNNKYFLAFCLLWACIYNATAQNLPNLSITGVPGTSTPIVIPSAYNQNGNSQPYLFNYKRVFSPQVPLTNDAAIDKNTSTSQVLMSTQYYDGLGRTIQTVSRNKNIPQKNYVEIIDNRQSSTEYSFLPYGTGGTGGFQMSPFQDQKAFYDQLYTQEQSTSYSVKQHISSNSTRSLSVFSPGKSTAGQSRGLVTSSTLNSANDIVIWAIDPATQYPAKVGFYNAGQLARRVTTGSDGSNIEEFTDKEGKLICKRILVRIDSTNVSGVPPVDNGGLSINLLAGGVAQWIYTRYYNTTYYVYDRLGGLRFTLSPKATEKLKAANWQVSADIIENLSDYVVYDNNNRINLKHFAGENGGEEFVYDQKNRKVLSRNPKLLSAGKWAFVLYDALDRPTISGYVTNSNSRAAWQQLIDNGIGFYTPNDLENYIVFGNGEGTYPQTLYNCDIQSYVYYDNYNFSDPVLAALPYNASFFNGNLVSSVYSVVPTQSNRTRGFQTGAKIKVIKPSTAPTIPNVNDWIYAVTYYDDFGHVIQTASKNFVSGKDYVSSQYNFKGQLLRNIVYSENPLCTAKPSTTIVKDYLYANYSFKLSGVRQKIDNGDWVQISGYAYDDLGRVIRKALNAVESQSYDYDIAGRLTGINKSYAETGSTGSNTTFGESIKYDYGFTNPLYNGNISGIVWKGPGAAPQKAYGYQYDLSGRMVQADYSEYNSPNAYSLAYWNNVKSDYSEKGIQYDANGNITALKRYGQVAVNNVIQPQLIDDLNFHYRLGDLSNQFDYTTDNVTNQTLTDYDFKDKGSSAVDYVYDPNGNLISDDNKKINIGYNVLNKAEQINFVNTGDYIRYVYDASGNKLMELYYIAGAKYDFKYLPSLVYKSDALQMLRHDEGYCLLNANNNFDYYYYVRDHLGNTRNVLQAYQAPISRQYLADHEIASANLENVIFSNIDLVRGDKPGSTDPNDTKAVILDANDPNKRVGTAILLQVMAGDQFNLAADAYYEKANNGNPIPPDQVLSSLIGTLTAGSGGIGATEAGQSERLINQMFTPENYLGVYSDLVQSVTDPALPQAYLNYIAFDENFKIIPEQSGAIQLSGDPGAWHTIGTPAPLTASRNGYLSVFLSSQSPVIQPVFDKFRVTLTRGNLVDENHYYPFGLTVNLASQSSIYNRYLFLGNMLDKTNGLHLYDFNARQYDPQVGRFLSIDPLHEYNNGYIYSKNNPVVFQDKTGLKGSESVWNSGVGLTYCWGASGVYGGGAAGFSLDADQRRAGNNAFWTTVGHVAMGVGGAILTGGLTEGEAAYVAAQNEARAAAEAAAFREGAESVASSVARLGGLPGGALRGQAERIMATNALGPIETALSDYSGTASGKFLTEYSAVMNTASATGDAVKPVAAIETKSMSLLNDDYTAFNEALKTGHKQAGAIQNLSSSSMVSFESGRSNLAFGIGDDLFKFAESKGFDTYRNFSVGFQQDKILEAMESYDNIHFNTTGFSRYKFSKFDPGGILNYRNYTNWEMHTIMNDPFLLNKTTFYKSVDDSYQIISDYNPYFK